MLFGWLHLFQQLCADEPVAVRRRDSAGFARLQRRRQERHRGIAYVPYFPLGGFSPLQSSTLSDVARRLGATPMQVALAWLLRRAPNILLIPGTSSLAHLRENLAATELELPDDALDVLDGISRPRSATAPGAEAAAQAH